MARPLIRRIYAVEREGPKKMINFIFDMSFECFEMCRWRCRVNMIRKKKEERKEGGSGQTDTQVRRSPSRFGLEMLLSSVSKYINSPWHHRSLCP